MVAKYERRHDPHLQFEMPPGVVESDSDDSEDEKHVQQRELLEAARNGEMVTVRKLLKAGVDVHCKGKLDGYGRSGASRVQPVGLG